MSSKCNRRVTQYILRNFRELEELPHPSERWGVRHMSFDDDKARELVARNIIVKVGMCENRRTLYKTDNRAYKTIQNYSENDPDDGILPCGCDAIENPRGVDGIRCPHCDIIFDKDEVESEQ